MNTFKQTSQVIVITGVQRKSRLLLGDCRISMSQYWTEAISQPNINCYQQSLATQKMAFTTVPSVGDFP